VELEVDRILLGDALTVLRTLPSESVHCIISSPPYFGLRDYGVAGQIGLEASPEEYVAQLVAVFAEARRVLRSDGTLWLNLGDSYANDGKWGGSSGGKHARALHGTSGVGRGKRSTGLKPKDLMMIPARVALALQADGWWLRSDIVWSKGNPMPESVTDRPTRAHEYIFLLSQNARYYYDADAIREPVKPKTLTTYGCTVKPSKGNDALGKVKADNWARSVTRHAPNLRPSEQHDKQRGHGRRHAGFNARWDAMSKGEQLALGVSKRDVWTVGTHPYPGAHFATFPPALIEPCVLAGCPPGGVVLDPFMGAGTVGVVARRHSRHYLGIELSAHYVALAEARIAAEIQPFLWTSGSPAANQTDRQTVKRDERSA
jgi:DNA modification methylase